MSIVPRRANASNSSTVDCGCGHTADVHRHYRRGSDCGLCSCEAYRAGSPATPVSPAPEARTPLRIG